MMKYAKWFWQYYRGHKRALAFLLIFTLVLSALMAIQPLLLKDVFDLLQAGKVKSTNLPYIDAVLAVLTQGKIVNYVILMIILGLAGFVASTLLIGHRAYLNTIFEWEIRQAAFSGITTKGPDFFNRFKTGDLVTRMTDDISEKISWFACSGIFRFYEAVTRVAFSLIMMLAIHPALTLWTVGPLPLLVAVYISSSSLMNRRFDFLQKRISDVNDTMEAGFSGIRVVKAYSREDDQKQRFATAADNRQRSEIDAVKTGAVIESLWTYIWQIGIVIVLLAGGYYVIKGSLSIGEFVAFNSYVILMLYPMFDIGNFLVRGLRAAVSINRLVELEDHRPMVTADQPGKAAEGAPRGQLEFDRVSFRFPDQSRDILSDISFVVEPGQRAALVGRVGSGKSWAVRLIPRLVNPTAGKIRLDGVDIADYNLQYLRRHIGYVPQEPLLFSDTIENNIRFGREGISDETLCWAVEVSQLNDDLAVSANGLKTKIGVRGLTISGGQKQRLALARALAGRPKILILDDCTSALDAKTEAALWDRLHEVMPDLTCFIVTHRPATLEKASNIIVFDDGRIVEQGGHLELILKEGLYCKLYHRIMLQEAVGG